MESVISKAACDHLRPQYMQHVLQSQDNTFSLPTRHILKLGQDHLASLFDAQRTPLA